MMNLNICRLTRWKSTCLVDQLKGETMSPDISMCLNVECDLNDRCYRYQAEPSDYQSYCDYSPHKNEQGFYACEGYWQIAGCVQQYKRAVTDLKKAIDKS